jgi:hypothetical protein
MDQKYSQSQARVIVDPRVWVSAVANSDKTGRHLFPNLHSTSLIPWTAGEQGYIKCVFVRLKMVRGSLSPIPTDMGITKVSSPLLKGTSARSGDTMLPGGYWDQGRRKHRASEYGSIPPAHPDLIALVGFSSIHEP